MQANGPSQGVTDDALKHDKNELGLGAHVSKTAKCEIDFPQSNAEIKN